MNRFSYGLDIQARAELASLVSTGYTVISSRIGWRMWFVSLSHSNGNFASVYFCENYFSVYINGKIRKKICLPKKTVQTTPLRKKPEIKG